MFENTFEQFQNVKCGLVYYPRNGGDNPLPVHMESADLRATVVHAAAEVIVTQTYVNVQKEAVDTFYYFPMHLDDAVTGLEVEINNLIRKNLIIREGLPDSHSAYSEAVRNHPKRFCIGPDDPPDIYQSRIGILEPKGRVTVTIAYVTELKLDVDRIQLRIPNTVVPRFKSIDGNAVPEETSKPDKAIDADEDVICIDLEVEDDNKQNVDPEPAPPTPVSVGTVKIQVEFLLEGESSISLLDCDSHVPQVAVIDQHGDKDNWTMAKIEFDGTVNEIDRDFVVSITASDPLQPRIYVEETPDETIVMSTICPIVSSSTSKPQFLFAFDSPSQSPLDKITKDMMKVVLQLLLKALPADSMFNLIGLELCSDQFFFPELQPRTRKESFLKSFLKLASDDDSSTISTTHYLSTTNLLEKLYGQVDTSDLLTQIILVVHGALKTDEMERCETLLRRNSKSHKSRLFVIGIGHNVRNRQIRKLASAGEGSAIQITYKDLSDPGWQASVTSIMTLANSPSLTDIKLIWGDWEERTVESALTPPTIVDDDLEIVGECAGAADKKPWQQIPNVLTPVFSGTQFVVFGIFTRKYYPRALDLLGTSYSKASESLELDYNVKIQDSRQRHTGSEDIITKLAYARALKQLEETIPKFTSCTSRKDRNEVLKRKEQILQIATREGIPSKYTYFATVDLETGIEVKGHWTRQTRFTSSTGDSPTSSHATSWNSRIPYGSIARNKLSSIRKLSAPDAPAAKIARIIETSDMIDLTEEQEA